MVGAFFEGFLLVGICSKSKVEDMIAYLCRNATDKRGLLLWVGIACIDRWQGETAIVCVSRWHGDLLQVLGVGRSRQVWNV